MKEVIFPRTTWYFLIVAMIVVLTMIILAGTAFAQSAPPAAPPVGAEGIIGLIRDSLTASLVAIMTAALAWLSTKASTWLGTRIDLNSTLEAMHWETYLTTATGKAFDYAQSKLGLTPDKITTWSEKNAFLRFAAEFLEAHHSDIVAYVDKNGNGVIDILDSALAKLAPSMPTTPLEEPSTSTTAGQALAAQGFMDQPAPVRRPRAAPVDDAATMATKLVRTPPKATARAAMQ